MSAIFTVKTVSELTAMLTEHPVRGIQNDDIAIVVGDNNADDTICFKAFVTESPVSNMPTSIASDDGKVQWDVVARSFADSGFPTGIKVNAVATSVPSGWEDAGFNGGYYKVATGKPSYGMSPAEMTKYGTDAWLLSGYFTKFDLANNFQAELFILPTFPNENSQVIGEQGKCLCQTTGLVHIVGGDDAAQTHHHTFDTSDGSFTANDKAALPSAKQDGKLIDASSINGKLYFFDNKTPFTDLFSYDITGNSWNNDGGRPVSALVSSSMNKPGDSTCIWVFFSSGEMYEFYPSTGTWTLVGTTTGTYDDSGNMGWDPIEELVWWHSYRDLYTYDPVTDTETYHDNFVDDLTDYGTSEVSMVHLENGYYFGCDYWGYYQTYIFAYNKYITMQKVK